MSSQSDLIYWLSNLTKGYPHLGPIAEITHDSFSNGLRLCALLHHFHGDAVVPYQMLNPRHKQFNLTLALKEADCLGIPRLMEVSDFLNCVTPDLKSVTLLLSYWHEYLALPADQRKDPSYSPEDLESFLQQRPERVAGYLSVIEALNAAASLCQRCGESLDPSAAHQQHPSYHSACASCLRCAKKSSQDLPLSPLPEFGDLFCEGCARFQKSKALAAGVRSPSASEIVRNEVRMAEMASIKEKRSQAHNPFAEAERLREEEKRKRLEAIRNRASAPSSASVSTPTPAPVAVSTPTPVVSTATAVPTPSTETVEQPTAYVFGDRCKGCSKVVYATEKIVAEKDIFHKACFRCVHCKGQLKLGNFASLEGKYYCKPHFKQLFALKGNYSEAFGSLKPQQQWEEAAAKEATGGSSIAVPSSEPTATVTPPTVTATVTATVSATVTATPSEPVKAQVYSTSDEKAAKPEPGRILSPFAQKEKEMLEERARRRGLPSTASTDAVSRAEPPRAKIQSPLFEQLEQPKSPSSTLPPSAAAAVSGGGKLGMNNPFKEAERKREEERRAKMEAILGRRT